MSLVKNWIVSIDEKVVYVSPDGRRYNLHDPARKSVLKMSGWGLPSAEIADSRGPFQHGTNPLTIRIPIRPVTVDIYHVGCSRNEYWENRIGLINALRLNRTNVNNPTPGNLRWYRSDGQIRQLDVFVTQGPDFDPETARNSFAFRETLEFTAHNPIIYNPTQKQSIFTGLGCTILQQLQFPFSFDLSNIIFGGNVCNATNQRTINYLGNWQEYPLITVVGPADNFRITHDQIGTLIDLDYSIPAGESVVFDLRYGRKTVTLGSNPKISLLGYISTNSDLGTFAIESDPIVVNGINSFTVSIDNGTPATQIRMNYYDRYVGI